MSSPEAQRAAALLALEQAKTPRARLDAAEALCDLAATASRDELAAFEPLVVRLLADADAQLRCAGLAMAVLVLEPAEAKTLLARFVGDATVRLRLEAVGRLADLCLPDARGLLAAALNDAVFAVRFEAARGLAELKHSAGIDVLLEALDDRELRFRASGALATLADQAALPRLRQAFHRWFLPAFDRTQLAGAMAQLGDAEGLAYLFKRANARWSMDKGMAVELLGQVKAPGAKTQLVAMLEADQEPCRGAAARGLGRLGDASVEPVLRAALERATLTDDDRLDIAEGLLLLGTPSARATVERLSLTDEHARAELKELLQ